MPSMARLCALAVVSLSALPALAQSAPEVPSPSPKARVEQRVGITDLSVEYSSPGVKGRKIWGGLVPYGKVWRTGANSATKLTASREFTIGGKKLAAGSYAIATIPAQGSWTVVLHTDVAGNGTQLDPAKEVARFTVKPTTLPAARERMSFLFSDTTDDSTNLDLEWEKLRVRLPIRLDTRAHVMAGVDKAVSDAWRPQFVAARYLLDTGGDLDRALELVTGSIAIKATWWNHWIKAQILGKQGKKADALAAAQKAQSLGGGDRIYEDFYKEQVASAIRGWK